MHSLTPPALHSLHSICSGGALGLSLDVCMCQQGGEVSDRTRGKLVVHRALRVHTCGESCTCEGECILGGVSALFGSWFPRHFCMTVSSPASVFE